jgi:hypothetical protein
MTRRSNPIVSASKALKKAPMSEESAQNSTRRKRPGGDPRPSTGPEGARRRRESLEICCAWSSIRFA